MQQSLFQLGQEDRRAEIERQINDALIGRGLAWPLSEEARRILGALRYAMGAAKALPISTLGMKTNLKAREIKQAVRELVVDHGMKIAGSRVEPYGYYFALTSEEIAQAVRPLVGELKAISRRVRLLTDKHYLHELLGQIEIELSQHDNEAA